jgi:hypothetical protein
MEARPSIAVIGDLASGRGIGLALSRPSLTRGCDAIRASRAQLETLVDECP